LGLGDVFSIHLAGNVASINAIGSMEYACKVMGSEVVGMMGHTNCSAVRAACEGVQLDNLISVLDHIHEAIDASAMPEEQKQCGKEEFINELAVPNVHYNMEAIMQTSTIIHDMVHSAELGIIGAMYNVNTGNVVFYDAKQNLKIKNEAFSIHEG
jgi:carbonic anhydrase